MWRQPAGRDPQNARAAREHHYTCMLRLFTFDQPLRTHPCGFGGGIGCLNMVTNGLHSEPKGKTKNVEGFGNVSGTSADVKVDQPFGADL